MNCSIFPRMLTTYSRLLKNSSIYNRGTLIKFVPVRTKMTAQKLNDVPDVEIEKEGTFKYVLIKVYAKESSGEEISKLIVRGGSQYGEYHGDIYDHTLATIQKLGLDSECLGGGRIKHDEAAKKLNVYGYSQGFGRADHAKAVEILKTAYKDYDISWNNDGY